MATAEAPYAHPTKTEGGPLTHRQIVTILIGLMMGMFLAALDQTIVATAIRTIADDLHGLSAQAWVTTAYLITSTIVVPLYGKLSDIYGRKPFFLFAISIFTVGSILCTLATSIESLAVYRAIQGLGAGGLFTLALAIIGDIVPPRERAKYQGYFLAVFATSSVLGPLIGGFFAGQDTILGITGWRWVFLVNVPIAIAALIVVQRTLHLHHTRLDHRIDWWGATFITVALIPLLLVAQQGREWGWSSPASLACFAIGAVGTIAFLLVERSMGDEALIPLRLFQIRTVAVASLGSIFIGMGMFGGLAAIPLYLQIVKGATPTEAGFQTLPLVIGIMFGSVLSGQLISRTGRYRHFPIIGAALLTLAAWLFHYVGATTPLWQTMAVMLMFGVGLGFNFQPLTLAVQNAVSASDIGVATASATFTRQIGGTLGAAIFLSILFSKAATNIPAAYQAAASTPVFQSAIQNPQGDSAANAQFISGLQAAAQGNSTAFNNALNDSSFLEKIDPRLAAPYLEGFSAAMQTVFFVATFILAIAFAISWLLPHVELRSNSAYSERGEQVGQGLVGDTGGEEIEALAPVEVAAGVGAVGASPQDSAGPSGGGAPSSNGSGTAAAASHAVPFAAGSADSVDPQDRRAERKPGRHRAVRGEKLH